MATTTTGRVSEETYRELALADPHGQLELYHGQLREKPRVSFQHGDVTMLLAEQLFLQLDRTAFHLRIQHARLRVSSDTYYVPEIAVIPAAIVRALRVRPHALDAYPDPLPLVIEVWSPSTGDYDVNEKRVEYQARGDLEIWRIHPYECTLTAWRRQPDGAYAETVYHGGIVRPESLPTVALDSDALFVPKS